MPISISAIPMTDVDKAVKKLVADARKGKGVPQYISLMSKVAPLDPPFQKCFNVFYRVNGGGRTVNWKAAFYDVFDWAKTQKSLPSYEGVLKRLVSDSRIGGRVERSFASKLLHTLDPTLPVIDKWILKNTGVTKPKNKDVLDAIRCYDELITWYAKALPDAKDWIAAFDAAFPAYCSAITDLKKIDFILWQLR